MCFPCLFCLFSARRLVVEVGGSLTSYTIVGGVASSDSVSPADSADPSDLADAFFTKTLDWVGDAALGETRKLISSTGEIETERYFNDAEQRTMIVVMRTQQGEDGPIVETTTTFEKKSDQAVFEQTETETEEAK